MQGIAKNEAIPTAKSILKFITSFTLFHSFLPTYWEKRAVPIIVVTAIISNWISVQALAWANDSLPPGEVIAIKLSTKAFKEKTRDEKTTGKAVKVKAFQTFLLFGKLFFRIRRIFSQYFLII